MTKNGTFSNSDREKEDMENEKVID